jgi:diguanylate cyclase (GGDEF)-like protein
MALFAALFAFAELGAEYVPASFSAVSHIIEIASMAGLLAAALWLYRGERREMREAVIAERGRERLAESLRRVGAAVTASLDLPTVLDTICRETCRLFDADVAVVWLLESGGQMLRPFSAQGVSAEEILQQRIPLADAMSVTARAARERRPVFINDLQHSSDGVPLLKQVTSAQAILAMPIVKDSEALGALVIVDSRRPQRFGQADAAIAELLGVQLAVAIANARHFEEARRRAGQMSLLNEITRASLSAADFHAMLQTLSDRLGELLEADGCYITLWDEARQQTIPTAAYGELRDTYPAVWIEPGEMTMTESVLRVGHALVAEDALHSPYISPRIAAMFPTRSLLGLPLIASGQKLGAALISFNRPHHFEPEEIALGEQAAGLVALAVARAQLFDEIRRRAEMLTALHDILLDITASRDLPSLLSTLVERAARLLGASGGGLYLSDPNRREVRCVVSFNTPRDYTGTVLKYGEGAAGIVAESGQPLVIDDYSLWPGRADVYESDQPFNAVISVPMIWQGGVTGVIHVLHDVEGKRFSQADLKALTLFASQAAIAVGNAHLLDAEKDHSLELDSLLTASKALLSTLELEPLLNNVLTAAINAIPAAEKGTILLRDAATGQLQIRAVSGYTDSRVSTFAFAGNDGYSAKAMRERRPLLIPDARADPEICYNGDISEARQILSAVVAPLTPVSSHAPETIDLAQPIGVISLDSTRRAAFAEADLRLLVAFANTAAVAIHHAQLHAEVQALAVTDSLTGIANRRAFDNALRIEVASAGRYNYPLSLLILDVDSFKVYNDAHGHPAGDERLKALAAMLSANVRDPDMAARYGGEEFAVILPHTGKAGALVFAERLRGIAESAAPPTLAVNGNPIPGYTVSIGVATFPEDAQAPETLVVAADNAELAAKRLGNNRVCAAPGLS